MKNSKRRNVIAASLVALCATVGVVGTVTYAVFKSENKVNVDVTSGIVDVKVAASDLVLSHKEADESEVSGYKTVTGSLYSGTASIDETTNTLTIDRMLPLDKIEFNLNITDNSNVKIKYRTILKTLEDSGLYDGLKITFDGVSTSKTDYELYEVGAGNKTIAVSIEMEEDAEDKYKGKSCKLAYVVEAYQGNAKINRDPVTASATVTVDSDNKVTEATTISSKDKTTTGVYEASITIPAGATVSDENNEVSLEVTSGTASSNIKATSAEKVETLEITLDGVDTTAGSVFIVDFYAKENLSNFVLYHKDNLMTKVDSEADVDADNEYFYNVTTGMVKMAVTSFSPFTYVNHKGTPVSTVSELTNALANGRKASLLNDISIDSVIDLANYSDVEIYGNGYSITPSSSSVTRVFQLNSSSTDHTISINDVKAYFPELDLTKQASYGTDSRAITVGANTGNVTINLNNCDFSGKYPVKIAGSNTNGVTLNINDSTISGYQTLDFWSKTTLNVTNSALYGYNYAAVSSSNDCAIIKLDGESATAATDSTLTFKNTLLDTNRPENGNIEDHISITVKASVIFDGCTFKQNGVSVEGPNVNAWDALYSGTDYDAADEAFAKRVDEEGWVVVK